jgi:hypothetical protein
MSSAEIQTMLGRSAARAPIGRQAAVATNSHTPADTIN